VQKARAGELLEQAERVREEQVEESKHRSRLQRFLELHTKALLNETQFTGLDDARSAEVTRSSALEALALFAAPDPSDLWTLAELPTTFSDDERNEIREGCYELLLILAEATVNDPGQGLRYLQQAARLDPKRTRAYLLRYANCRARQGEVQEAERARNEARQIQPASALDHFLTGQELYKRGEWKTAHEHFAAALRLRLDHFWAHCLAAVCCLQMNQPREAIPELNACLQLQRDFAWLYVLRGYTLSLTAARDRDESVRLAPDQVGAAPTAETPLFRAAEADFQHALTLLEHQRSDELRYVALVDRGLMWYQRHDRRQLRFP
jgi:tetratricopeptide (TPR) repeat protein